jgi:hypothetical protein
MATALSAPRRDLRTLAAGVLCASFLTGCGSDRPDVYPVSGTVVFSDGKPVKLGTVEFLHPEFKTTAVGTIQEDGSFMLGTFASDDGACAGEHQVIVSQMMVIDTRMKHQKDHGSPVDPLYGSYSSSPLRAIVEAKEANRLVLTVEKAAK